MIKLKDFNPIRLKNTRMYRAKTLDILATETKINKKDIIAFEEGKYLPTLDNSLKLARALNFPQEYFYKKDNVKVVLENTHISVPGRVPRVEEVACREQLLMIHKIVAFLEKSSNIPKLNLPMNVGKNVDIERLAQKTRECFTLDNDPIYSLVDVMEENGIIVSDINSSKRGAVALTQKQSIDKNIRYIVCLGNDDQSLARRNYEMAYELAYIVSNSLGIPTKRFSKDDFVGAFLMPRENFIKDLTKVDDLNAYVELKKKWNVPISIMLYRAHQLGILNYKKYNYLMNEINKKGWLNKEPLDNEVKAKSPQILKNLAKDKGIENLLYDLSKIGIDIYSKDVENLLGLKVK